MVIKAVVLDLDGPSVRIHAAGVRAMWRGEPARVSLRLAVGPQREFAVDVLLADAETLALELSKTIAAARQWQASYANRDEQGRELGHLVSLPQDPSR